MAPAVPLFRSIRIAGQRQPNPVLTTLAESGVASGSDGLDVTAPLQNRPAIPSGLKPLAALRFEEESTV